MAKIKPLGDKVLVQPTKSDDKTAGGIVLPDTANYSNENFPRLAVEELRRLGHDVLTVREAGKADQAIADNEVLAFATSLQRAVLTINRKHFIRLHREQPQHAGIIVCTLDLDFAGQAQRIHDAIQEHSDLSGQLIRVNRPQ